jgi:DNA-binding winged helix-turn-helix (wHTH) protein/serine/threonine protein kinase
MDAQRYRWRFGAVEFDEARRELRVAGLVVEIEHKPLEVLSLLLRHAGEVVTKDELFETVWAGRITVDHVLSTAIGKLRKVLDAGEERRIATVPRIGYRFDGPVERMAVGAAPASPLALETGQPVPGRPHFVLERQLGRTLGSEVWLAKHPRSRDVRVFKFALDTERLTAIKREATLLRLLRDSLGEREDIVRVCDWNFESSPYFLESEYGGQSLPEWAMQEDRLARLDRGQRIALFAPVVEAVAAAHGVGVLHKDLKPGNVLIAPNGDAWQVRLTDFGNSRLLQPERLAELGITALGLTVTHAVSDSTSGTLPYLAPEVLGGQPPTVRSDVYALGVMLYQFLVGDLRRPLVSGWEREIDDPLLREDIAQATDGDPARRIASAVELAGRLRRLPERRAERMRREAEERAASDMRQSLERARARRPWIAATIAVLAAGLALSGFSWWRSEQQKRIAQQQAARAETVVRFLSDDLIGSLSPGSAGFERDPTVKDMLLAASDRIERMPDDAAVRGSIHAALGQSWRTLGDRERGVSELRQAVHNYTAAFGHDDDTTLKTRYALARTQAYANSAAGFAEAGKELAAADRDAGARLQGENDVALNAALARGIFHSQQMQTEPALAAWQKADRLQRKLRPDDAQQAVVIRENLADATLRQGRTEEAVTRLRAMLADPLLDAGRIGETRVAAQRALLARALRNLGRYDEALPFAQSAAAASERILGPDNYQTLVQLSLVASIHEGAGHCPDALRVARTVRARMAARYGEDKQGTLVETGNLGLKEYDCGDREAGLGYLHRAESGLRTHYGEDNVAAHSFRYALAQALTEQRRYREALAMAEGLGIEALTAGDSMPGWEYRLDALRGEILIGLERTQEGRALIAAALPRLIALDGIDAGDAARLRKL